MTEISPALTSRIHLQHLRTRILINLDRVYPRRLQDAELRSLESDPPGIVTIRRELHYLHEKGFVTIAGSGEEIMGASITAKGRDFVMGEFEEVGIAPGSAYNYAGK